MQTDQKEKRNDQSSMQTENKRTKGLQVYIEMKMIKKSPPPNTHTRALVTDEEKY